MANFQKAERKQARLKLAFTGPSGSGKTFSALLVAIGIGKRIAVIDTENHSASLYADMKTGPLAGIEFDALEIDPPYTIDKYTDAIELAEKQGYAVLVIDSISHAWAGEGGLLEKKGALDARGGNSYTNWSQITPEHERFKAKLLQANIHLICTMRSKQDYILEVNDKGKQAPKKVGLAPVQRDGMEFEFTTVFDMAMDHNAGISKDRTSLFDGKIFKPSKKTGETLLAWLKEGKPLPAPAMEPKAEPEQKQPAAAPAPPAEDDIPGEVKQPPAERLNALLAELRELGHVFGDKQNEYINALRTEDDFVIAIEFFGKKRDAYLAAKGNGHGRQAS